MFSFTMPVRRTFAFCAAVVVLITSCTSAPGTATATPTVIPATQTPTVTPTIPPSSTPTETPLPLVTVEGLRFAYIIDGNLYVQDSGGQPKQITFSGQDREPSFTDDGQKIVFYRGETSIVGNIYSINADGSREKELVTPDSLVKLNVGYNQLTQPSVRAVIPGTHNVLFSTGIDSPNYDLLLVNADSGEIKQLLYPGNAGIFLSPNGNMDMTYTDDYIDVISTFGQFNRRHMILYHREWDYEWIEPFWSNDSKIFLFVAPISGNGDGTDGPEPNSIWKYSIDRNKAVRILLNPAPMDRYFTFSPDGNWIVYSYFFYEGKNDRSIPSGIYISNLQDNSSHFWGSAQSYGLPDSYEWSPDSEHFIFPNVQHTEIYLGNTQGEVTSLNSEGFVGWIDDNRFLSENDGLFMFEVREEKKVLVVTLPMSYKDLMASDFSYVFYNPNINK